MGIKDDAHFTNYHSVLNKAKWNILQGAKILLGPLIFLIHAGLPMIVAVDETIERRKGRKITRMIILIACDNVEYHSPKELLRF